MVFEEIKKSDIINIAMVYVKTFNAKPWNDKWTIETAYNRLMQMVNCEGFYGLMLKESDNIIGIILGNHEYYFTGMQFLIKEFCIDPNFQGKGFGKELLNEFSARLKENGIKEIYLFTSKEQSAFYKKHDFWELNNIVFMNKEL